jgi:hypothetical protein
MPLLTHVSENPPPAGSHVLTERNEEMNIIIIKKKKTPSTKIK